MTFYDGAVASIMQRLWHAAMQGLGVIASWLSAGSGSMVPVIRGRPTLFITARSTQSCMRRAMRLSIITYRKTPSKREPFQMKSALCLVR